MTPNYENIFSDLTFCKSCRLSETRINAVSGEGRIPSKMMFIAQAPGRIEDISGKILIGPSGKVLDELLGQVHLKRSEIYLTNLLKCFLPKCRKPRHDEKEICFHRYLKKEIELVKPEIIIPLGFHVTRFIFGLYALPVPNKFEIKSTFGRLFVSKNIKILPLKHPATIVHKNNSLQGLLKNYRKLEVLLNPCQKQNLCLVMKNYQRGLIPEDYVEEFCYGDWESCEYLYS